jgi:enamine deaminase RidA (YjgF/YER057c/UK114 family)
VLTLKQFPFIPAETLSNNREGYRMSREYFKGEAQEKRSYSRAVKVKNGTTVYLAGVGGAVDANGNSLAGNFKAQVQTVFERLRQVMADVGGSLDDMCSALITVESLARPEMLVEIQGIAVLD